MKGWKGASKREVIRHFVKQAGAKGDIDQKVETSYHRFRSELEGFYSKKLVPIRGAVETFRWCQDPSILLATTTGFYREISDPILRQTGWRRRECRT